MFLFQAEAEIVGKFFTDPLAVIHPFTVLPLLGQILLLITLFQKQPSRLLTYLGMGCIGILLVLIEAIGIMTGNWKMMLSALPFLAIGFWVIREHRKNRF